MSTNSEYQGPLTLEQKERFLNDLYACFRPEGSEFNFELIGRVQDQLPGVYRSLGESDQQLKETIEILTWPFTEDSEYISLRLN